MAITAQQVETALASVIQTVPAPDGMSLVPSIFMQAPGMPGTQVVPVSAFVTLFEAAAALTYADLSAIDGGTLGYAPFLAAWHAAGLI